MSNNSHQTRRIVVSPGQRGTDVVTEEVGVSVETAQARISDVWLTDSTTDRAPATDGWSLLPDDNGTIWRIVEFKAGNVPADRTTGMHKTPTIDMGVVLSGSILLVLEDASTVELKAGDIFVLRGIQHTWVNTGEEPCVMSIVLVRSR